MAEGFWRQTSDNKLVASAYSEMTAPTGHDFVLTSTIEAAYTGEIWQDGTWDGTEYKPPTNIIVPYDAGTDAGQVQIAAALMLDVLEGGADYIRDNRPVWPQQPVEWALTGIHWQIVNAARIVLNSVRTVDFRVKFCEEAASWPSDATNGDPASYVDTFATGSITEAPGEKFSWVDPDKTRRYEVQQPVRLRDLRHHDQRRGRAGHRQIARKGMAQ